MLAGRKNNKEQMQETANANKQSSQFSSVDRRERGGSQKIKQGAKIWQKGGHTTHINSQLKGSERPNLTEGHFMTFLNQRPQASIFFNEFFFI